MGRVDFYACIKDINIHMHHKSFNIEKKKENHRKMCYFSLFPHFFKLQLDIHHRPSPADSFQSPVSVPFKFEVAVY